jgi:hypothetical protein
MKLTKLQQEHLLAVSSSIIEHDTAETITVIIIWPDASKPGGVGNLLFDEENDEVSTFLVADESEARKMHALLNAAGPRPLVPIGH